MRANSLGVDNFIKLFVGATLSFAGFVCILVSLAMLGWELRRALGRRATKLSDQTGASGNR